MSTTTAQPTDHPRVGMLSTLRHRRGFVTSVDPFDAGAEGRLHLVRVQYTDGEEPHEDTVIWEREHPRKLLEPHALPRVGETPPMVAGDFDALVRASRWSALTPFLSPDGSGAPSQPPVAAPFFGAVQVDDFQLVPLLKAIQMPRVSLLLADDVGLGKTIEAGLILTELLRRRRVRRVLVICPASLRDQWRQEMQDKFALTFDVVDRAATHALQKRLGLDVNPWRTWSRIITSYHYLRQPDVLEQLLTTCRPKREGTAQPAQLPWDLLIVDEAHNLMPAAFGEDSELARMLRHLSPYFEHKLFLTATPHNGHTRCFSGLLEQLDPVRFRQTGELTAEERQRVDEIVVRRLKREINELDDEAKRPRRFAERFLEPEPLFFRPEEKALSAAFGRFRRAVRRQIAASRRAEQLAGSFAIEVLNKRLLSSPTTFAESWFRMKRGLAEEKEPAEAAEVAAARRASEEEIDDDREREGRARHAARTIGAWLQPLAGSLETEIAEIDDCLAALGIREEEETVSDPDADTRFERLLDVIRKRVRGGKEWRDERLIVFTEYKTTLDYLERRLRAELEDRGRAIRVLYGSGEMDDRERNRIKAAFNDPDDAVRVLIATDAASEGLNLHETARYILHYEIPWNPSRLEQRNGRLDRHGQARDVYVHHFTSEDDADLRFVAHVVGKVHEIREDLGSMGEVFDAAFERRFQDQEDAEAVIDSLDRNVESHRGRAAVPVPRWQSTGAEHLESLRALLSEIDLSPETLRDTLEAALGLDAGHPRLEGPDAEGRMKLVTPLPPRWEPLIDDTLRLGGGLRGPLPSLIFDPKLFVRDLGGRPVFRAAKDTVLLHLGHPLFRQALAVFASARFRGGGEDLGATRWTVRRGGVPAGADGLILLTLEELATNELREPFHHWVRTLRLPIEGGELGEPLEHLPASGLRPEPLPAAEQESAVDRAVELWDEVGIDVRDLVRERAAGLTGELEERLDELRGTALAEEKRRFDERLAEVRSAMAKTSIQRLERERDERLAEMRQLVISEEMHRSRERELRDLEAELDRRRSHYDDLLKQLRTDQERVLERMLPRRYRLSGQAQVYPVAVEIRLPEAAS